MSAGRTGPSPHITTALLKLRRTAVIGILLLAGACANSLELTVASNVPEPVVTPLPLNVGVYYSEAFRNRIFQEDSDDREEWRIDSRDARLAMFGQVTARMFVESIEIAEIPPSNAPELDAILVPEFDEMQVALPDETRTDFFEAWIRYRLRLLEPDGDPIDSWTVTGYGKQDKEGIFTSREENLNAAIELALRDVGAKLALGFTRQSKVRRWLCARPDAPNHLCPARIRPEEVAARRRDISR